MLGQRVGQLEVIDGAPNTASGHRAWMCRCDCGSVKAVRQDHLNGGLVKSCGCLRHKTKRGYVAADCPEFWIWVGIKQRCLNPNDKSYRKYGGRGIKVCARWAVSFEAFYADMGPRPSASHSVDRIDNNGNYEPGNCRWADITTQARNTRTNNVIEWNGVKKCASEWGEQLGIKPNTIICRLRSGWSPEEALTTPIIPREKRRAWLRGMAA